MIPGGTEPDWGPADVPAAARWHAQPTQPAQPAQPDAARKLSLKVLCRRRRKAGVKLSVKVPGQGQAHGDAKSGKKIVGKTSKQVTKAGTAP